MFVTFSSTVGTCEFYLFICLVHVYVYMGQVPEIKTDDDDGGWIDG